MWLSALHFYVCNQNAYYFALAMRSNGAHFKGISFYVNVRILSASKVAILKAIFYVFKRQSNNLW